MKRHLISSCVSLGSLCAAGLCLAGPASAASVEGKISQVGQGTLTIQTPGRTVGVVNALSAAASRINRQDLPYVYGGGHAQAGIASVGMKGPGYNGRRIGYDCSGSVAAVLRAGGLWPAAAGVPSDAGVISEMLSRGLIARGAGTGPVEVTLYDNPGVHIFMNIDGRFFGTSDGGGGANRHGGAGWLDDGAPDAFSRTYRRYHVLASALSQSTNAAHTVTFQLRRFENPDASLLAGVKVRVSYQQTKAGTLEATALAYPGAMSATGVVTSLGGSSVAIQTSTGSTLTLATAASGQLLAGVSIGDGVKVTYTKSSGRLVLLAASVTSPAAPSGTPPTGTTSAASSSVNGGGAGSWRDGQPDGSGSWNGR